MSKWIKKGAFKRYDVPQNDTFDKEPFQVIITESYIFKHKGIQYKVPVGFISDGHSNPDVLEMLTGDNYFEVRELLEQGKNKEATEVANTKGCPLIAGFLHDYLCKVGLEGEPECSWADAHMLFRKAMRSHGVPLLGRATKLFGDGAYMKWRAVRIGMMFRKWDY